MADLIVACAGCGKRYKGSVTGKNFKCADCNNLFTFPDAPRVPEANKTFCTHCWAEMDIAEDLKDCPSCGQKVTPNHTGKATLSAGGSGHHAQADAEMHAQMTALTKERDELVEVRRKQDKTMGNLLEQLAFAKATKPKDAAESSAGWELKMEVGELKTRLSSLEEENKRLQAAGASSGAATPSSGLEIASMQGRIAELEAQLAVAGPGASPFSADTEAALQARIAELEAQLAGAPAPSAPDETGSLRARIADLEAQLAAEPALPSLTPAHGVMPVSNSEDIRLFEIKVAELENQLSTLEQSQARAERERGEALERAQKAESELEQFRSAAVQALEPLGAECNRSMKQLMADADTMLEKVRAQLQESNKLLEQQLESSGVTLKEQLATVRREMAERFANVLGSAAEVSPAQPAVTDTQAVKQAAESAA